MRKRLLATLLCLCVALTLMPAAAFALDAAASLTVDGVALVTGGAATGNTPAGRRKL